MNPMIEAAIEEYDQRVYNGHMPPYARQTMRAMLARELRQEEKWGEKSNADLLLGFDDGEPIKGY